MNAPSIPGPATRRQVLRTAAVVVAVLAAVGSVAIGARRALSPEGGFGSSDFQWSPARLFLEGVDPYQARLDGSPEIILTQSPNYLHLLYELLVPFGAAVPTASIVWLVLTVALAVGLAVFYARTASLGRTGTLLLVAMVLASTPMRLGLGYGQHAVFLLVFATVAFAAAARPWAGAPLAVALTKYSFAPLALVLLVAGRLRTVVMAGVVLFAGAVVFAVVTSTNLLEALLAPFEVSRTAVGDGAADVMTVAGLTPWLDGNDLFVTALAVGGSVLLACLARRQIRSGDWVFVLGIASVDLAAVLQAPGPRPGVPAAGRRPRAAAARRPALGLGAAGLPLVPGGRGQPARHADGPPRGDRRVVPRDVGALRRPRGRPAGAAAGGRRRGGQAPRCGPVPELSGS